MHVAIKIVAAVLGAAVIFGGRRGGVPILTYYAQGDAQWRNELLGFSSTVNIWSAGCMLTALGMSAGALWGPDHDFDPSTMNDLCKKAGAFSGPNLELSPAADAVDLRAPDSKAGGQWAPQGDEDDRIRETDGASLAELRALIRRTLQKGGVCLVNVDKVFTATGEHWLCLHAESGGQFLCADPATGKDTLIDVSTMRNPAVDWGDRKLVYDVVGVAPLYKGAAT